MPSLNSGCRKRQHSDSFINKLNDIPTKITGKNVQKLIKKYENWSTLPGPDQEIIPELFRFSGTELGNGGESPMKRRKLLPTKVVDPLPREQIRQFSTKTVPEDSPGTVPDPDPDTSRKTPAWQPTNGARATAQIGRTDSPAPALSAQDAKLSTFTRCTASLANTGTRGTVVQSLAGRSSWLSWQAKTLSSASSHHPPPGKQPSLTVWNLGKSSHPTPEGSSWQGEEALPGSHSAHLLVSPPPHPIEKKKPINMTAKTDTQEGEAEKEDTEAVEKKEDSTKHEDLKEGSRKHQEVKESSQGVDNPYLRVPGPEVEQGRSLPSSSWDVSAEEEWDSSSSSTSWDPVLDQHRLVGKEKGGQGAEITTSDYSLCGDTCQAVRTDAAHNCEAGVPPKLFERAGVRRLETDADFTCSSGYRGLEAIPAKYPRGNTS